MHPFSGIYLHPSRCIDDGPRLYRLQPSIDRLCIGDIERTSRKRDGIDSPLIRHALQGMAKRPVAAGDQQRPLCHTSPVGPRSGVRARSNGAFRDAIAWWIQQPLRAVPPRVALQHGMFVAPDRGECLDHRDQGGRPRCRCAQIERSTFVVHLLLDQQGAPVESAEQRPRRDRAHVVPPVAETVRRCPRFIEPQHLLLTCARQMDFRHRHRKPVALESLLQQCFQAEGATAQHPDGFHIGVATDAISPMKPLGIARDVVVQKTFAGDVVIDPENRRAQSWVERRVRDLL